MAPDQSAAEQGLKTLLEAPPETIASVAMLVVAALAQAWKTYNDRPQQKRIGRRASDLDCERLEKSQAKIEHELEELAGKLDRFAGVLERLEARGAGAAPP
jgi:hypothetical protein